MHPVLELFSTYNFNATESSVKAEERGMWNALYKDKIDNANAYLYLPYLYASIGTLSNSDYITGNDWMTVTN
jgi:hypothetical protein